MKNLKIAISHATLRAQVGTRLALQKLKENAGIANFSDAMFLCAIGVVVAGLLIAALVPAFREWIATLTGRISDMFNYK